MQFIGVQRHFLQQAGQFGRFDGTFAQHAEQHERFDKPADFMQYIGVL